MKRLYPVASTALLGLLLFGIAIAIEIGIDQLFVSKPMVFDPDSDFDFDFDLESANQPCIWRREPLLDHTEND